MKAFLIRILKFTSHLLLFALIAIPIWFFYEPPPVSYSVRKVLTPTVAPGDVLKIQISADIQKQCDALVFRTIIDSTGLPFTLEAETRPNETDYVVEVPVPPGATAGPANYRARLLWSCNFVQRWFPREVIQRNIPFVIAPLDGQMPMPERQGIYQAPLIKSDYARIQGN